MFKTVIINKSYFYIKLFTHAAAVVILLMNNSVKNLPYVITLALVVLFASYSRQYFLAVSHKTFTYKLLSTAIEFACILGIGLFDSTSYLLFFFVCVSEAIISNKSRHPGIVLIALFLLFRYLFDVFYLHITSNADVLFDIFLRYGVSIAFVGGTSYFVKSQIREKEKLARVNAELELAYKKLLDTSAAAEQLSVEKERVRMAREIHDTLAHTLTSLIVQLEVCKKLSSADTTRLAEELGKAQEVTRNGLNDVKRTIKSLRPQALEEKPFFESVLDLVSSTMNNTEVHIILENNLPPALILSTIHEISLFRIIQESITNSIRHGQAKEIQISMSQNGSNLRLHIQDNGAGCSRVKKGYGLSGIQERLEAVGGRAEFTSTAGHGFATEAIIPLGGFGNEN